MKTLLLNKYKKLKRYIEYIIKMIFKYEKI